MKIVQKIMRAYEAVMGIEGMENKETMEEGACCPQNFQVSDIIVGFFLFLPLLLSFLRPRSDGKIIHPQ